MQVGIDHPVSPDHHFFIEGLTQTHNDGSFDLSFNAQRVDGLAAISGFGHLQDFYFPGFQVHFYFGDLGGKAIRWRMADVSPLDIALSRTAGGRKMAGGG